MTLRYTVAAAGLLLGLAIVVTGLAVSPQVTTVSCTQEGSASQGGANVETTSPECTTTTEPAPGQRTHLLALGLVVFGAGGGVVVADVVLGR